VLRALARVDLGAISRNCALLARRVGPGTALCAVVKADGYGHGAVPAARAALAGGASWLAVATAEEAAGLRAAGLDGPVMVMGALSAEELGVAVAARADVVAWREGFVEQLAALPGAEGIGVHVKLDTGMGRLGTRDAEEALGVVHEVAAQPRLRLAGAMTHFATADDDPAFMDAQLRAFAPWAASVRDEFPDVLVHAANSAATLRGPAAHFDLVRCGVAIYGLDPFQADAAAVGLEPALELRSYVAEVKRARPGESVGYGRRFVAASPTWIGTLPIGYGDGYRRGLTNDAEVLIGGRPYPLVGTVSMDNITVDLGPGDEARELRGAPAVVLGPGFPAEEWARRLGTINYEVTCGIGPRVPREYA
jgi:alanine racemase